LLLCLFIFVFFLSVFSNSLFSFPFSVDLAAEAGGQSRCNHEDTRATAAEEPTSRPTAGGVVPSKIPHAARFIAPADAFN
jgi:hypothetical protein